MAADRPGFFEELKRRHVWRVAVAYAVSGWLLVQIATQVFPIFHMPDWTAQLVVLLVVLGFPVAVIFAWVYEVTPEGVRRTAPAGSAEARPEAASRQIGRKLNTVIITVLVLAVALLGWRLLVLRHAGGVSAPKTIADAQAGSPDAAQRNPGTNAPPDSIAGAIPSGRSSSSEPVAFNPPADTLVVLPFANLGGDPKQQYFSDGITEELTNALGQNTALRVIAWDTASKYRDSTQSATDIAKTLDVANVLTGKILRQGNEVRVIVELVNARTGYQAWSHHYDDSLSNIFQVQDEISASIADALKVKFAAAGGAHTVNPQAYDLVQRAKALPGFTASSIEKARALLEQAITLDPDYAQPHADLARIWLAMSQFSTLPLKDALAKVRAEANKALALDPHNVTAIVTLADANLSEGQLGEARTGYQRALRLDPSNAGAHLEYSLALPIKQSLAQTLKAVRLDPENTSAQNDLATVYQDLGQYEQALAPLQKLQRLAPHSAAVAFELAQTYALLHQNEDAVKAFDQIQPDTPLAKRLIAAGRLTYRSILDPGLHAQALAAVKALRRRSDLNPYSQAFIIQLDLALGDKRAALDHLPDLCAAGPAMCSDLGINPTWLLLHGDPKFEALVKKYDTTSQPSAFAAPGSTVGTP